MNTAPVPGQTPHDESDRRTEPRSSVSDLVNSLTSEMLMVRRAGGPGQGEGQVWRLVTAWGSCKGTSMVICQGRLRIPILLQSLD